MEDFPALAACWQDLRLVRHIGDGQPHSREMSWGRLLRYIRHWQMLGYGYWACEEKETGKNIGGLGLQNAGRDIAPALLWPEAGWTLIPEAQGLGYAREAMSAALAWADSELRSPLCCIIDEQNLRSIRLAEKLGFRFSHLADYRQKSVQVYLREPPSSAA